MSMEARIKELIGSLLDKTAERGCTQSEAEAAAAKIQELLAKYRLTLADTVEEAAAPIQEETTSHSKARRAPAWFQRLASAVARANGCFVYTSYRRNPLTGILGTHVELVGTQRNRETALWLLRHLASQVDCLAMRHAYGQGRLFVAAYRIGVATAIGERLCQAAQDAHAGASGRALVAVQLQDAALARYKASLPLRSGRGTLIGDSDGYALGVAHGRDRVSMSAPMGNSSALGIGRETHPLTDV